jgi:hypothetical protein
VWAALFHRLLQACSHTLNVSVFVGGFSACHGWTPATCTPLPAPPARPGARALPHARTCSLPPTSPPHARMLAHPSTHVQVHLFNVRGERQPLVLSLGVEVEEEGVEAAAVFRGGLAVLTPGGRLWCAGWPGCCPGWGQWGGRGWGAARVPVAFSSTGMGGCCLCLLD